MTCRTAGGSDPTAVAVNCHCLFSDYEGQYLLKMGGQLDKRMLHWQPGTCIFSCSLLYVICRIKYYYYYYYYYYCQMLSEIGVRKMRRILSNNYTYVICNMFFLLFDGHRALGLRPIATLLFFLCFVGLLKRDDRGKGKLH